MICYVGPDLGRKPAPASPVASRANAEIHRVFRRALLDDPGKFRMTINVVGHPPLLCHWVGCGPTAGVAAWAHGPVWEAVTAYLNGVDVNEETLLVERALASRPLPIPLYRWHRVRAARRPVYATFLLTPASVEDRVIATSAPALAHTFFGLLGTIAP